MGWGMIGMGAMMVLFWGLVVFGIAWLIRGAARGSSATGESLIARETPVEILERRFAEGGISLEDYQERRTVLVHGPRAGKVAQ